MFLLKDRCLIAMEIQERTVALSKGVSKLISQVKFLLGRVVGFCVCWSDRIGRCFENVDLMAQLVLDTAKLTVDTFPENPNLLGG